MTDHDKLREECNQAIWKVTYGQLDPRSYSQAKAENHCFTDVVDQIADALIPIVARYCAEIAYPHLSGMFAAEIILETLAKEPAGHE